MSKTEPTTKVKAVHSITMVKPGTGTDGKPVQFLEIAPNSIFDCPKSALPELRAAGAVTSLAKVTPSQALERADDPDADDDDDDDDDNGQGEGTGGAPPAPEKKSEVDVTKKTVTTPAAVTTAKKTTTAPATPAGRKPAPKSADADKDIL